MAFNIMKSGYTDRGTMYHTLLTKPGSSSKDGEYQLLSYEGALEALSIVQVLNDNSEDRTEYSIRLADVKPVQSNDPRTRLKQLRNRLNSMDLSDSGTDHESVSQAQYDQAIQDIEDRFVHELESAEENEESPEWDTIQDAMNWFDKLIKEANKNTASTKNNKSTSGTSNTYKDNNTSDIEYMIDTLNAIQDQDPAC